MWLTVWRRIYLYKLCQYKRNKKSRGLTNIFPFTEHVANVRGGRTFQIWIFDALKWLLPPFFFHLEKKQKMFSHVFYQASMFVLNWLNHVQSSCRSCAEVASLHYIISRLLFLPTRQTLSLRPVTDSQPEDQVSQAIRLIHTCCGPQQGTGSNWTNISRRWEKITESQLCMCVWMCTHLLLQINSRPVVDCQLSNSRSRDQRCVRRKRKIRRKGTKRNCKPDVWVLIFSSHCRINSFCDILDWTCWSVILSLMYPQVSICWGNRSQWAFSTLTKHRIDKAHTHTQSDAFYWNSKSTATQEHWPSTLQDAVTLQRFLSTISIMKKPIVLLVFHVILKLTSRCTDAQFCSSFHVKQTDKL